MSIHTTFPELPLGDGEASSSEAVGQQGTASTPPIRYQPVAEREADQQPHYHPDYLRLFGFLSPSEVITVLPDNPVPAGHHLASPPAFTSDPIAGGEASFYSRALHDVARLRAKHLAKGKTPATDAAHGSAYFWRCADQAWHDAMRARSPEKRRELLVIAAAILVAQIDAEDFQSQQEPTP